MTSPIIPYIGGKRRLANKLLPMFPDHMCYVEPFCGAAALYFLKAPSKSEALNDVNGDIVNLYRVITHHLEEFVRQFKWAVSSRKVFEWQKMTRPEVLACCTLLLLAAPCLWCQGRWPGLWCGHHWAAG